MVLALLLCGLFLVLVLLALFVFGLRRRLIQRSGGTFDCSLRWDAPEPPSAPQPSAAGSAEDGTADPVGIPDEAVDQKGKGWSYGVARYRGDRVEWFRVFSYAPRPRRLLERELIEVLERRTPQGEEELALLSDAVVLACKLGPHRVELAMSEDALTGFLAWLEAAPPGQRVNVA